MKILLDHSGALRRPAGTRLLTVLLLAALATFLSASGPEASAQSAGTVKYTVTDLGTLAGLPSSGARGINDSGQIVGGSGSVPDAGDTHGFLWESGTMTDLGTLGGGDYSSAFGVNGSGQVVGESSYPVGPDGNGPTKAFRWQNGSMNDLGALLASPDEESHAYAINGSGQVVGESKAQDNDGSFWDRAFLYQNGNMTDLGTLGPSGSPGKSVAYGINDSGQVVGEADLEDFAGRHAFLWQNGQMTDLGTLGGSAFSVAYDINASGQVVGESNFTGFIWQNGSMSPLGNIEPAAINDSGRVVGKTCIFDGGEGCNDYAAVYESGQVKKLNDLIDPTSGWNLREATDINEDGQIVGTGTINGESRAVLLTPEPQDTTAPTITGTTPDDEATGVARNSNVTATFSEEMDPNTLDASTVKLQQRVKKKGKKRWVTVNAGVGCDTPCKTVTLDPFPTDSSKLLGANRNHRVIVTGGAKGVKDPAGNVLAKSYSWTFKTGNT